MEHDEDDVGLQRFRRVYRVQKGAHVKLFIVRAVILVQEIHRVLCALRQLQAAEALGIGDDRYLVSASMVLCKPDSPFWMEQVLAVCKRSKPMVDSVMASESGAR